MGVLRPAPGQMAFGIQLPIQAQSAYFVAKWERSAGPSELAQVAKAADDAGFFYVAVCDHIALPREMHNTTGPWWSDCLTTLGFLAAHTTRTALLSHVYVLAYRHPMVAAKGFATLDHLSSGRAIAGVGAGHVKAEFEMLDVAFEKRGKILDEHLSVFRDALASQYPEIHTQHYDIVDMGASPRPTQSPRPPIWVGGSSPAAIRRAATTEGWLPQGPSNAEMIATLRHYRTAAGLGDEPMMIGHITPLIYVGTASWDLPAGTITGSPERVAQQIDAATPKGVNQLQVRFSSRSCQEQCDQIEAFGAHVAPLLPPR